LFEVEHHPDDVVRELQELPGHRFVEAVDTRNAVANLDHAADLLKVDLGFIARELSLDDFADLSGLDHSRPFSETATGARAARCSVTPFACQLRPEAGELAVEAAIDDVRTHLGYEAAQEAVVHGLVQLDVFAVEGAT